MSSKQSTQLPYSRHRQLRGGQNSRVSGDAVEMQFEKVSLFTSVCCSQYSVSRLTPLAYNQAVLSTNCISRHEAHHLSVAVQVYGRYPAGSQEHRFPISPLLASHCRRCCCTFVAGPFTGCILRLRSPLSVFGSVGSDPPGQQ